MTDLLIGMLMLVIAVCILLPLIWFLFKKIVSDYKTRKFNNKLKISELGNSPFYFMLLVALIVNFGVFVSLSIGFFFF
jgi:Na+/melibiose symporter-like transporter